jgi:hypothetical protein
MVIANVPYRPMRETLKEQEIIIECVLYILALTRTHEQRRTAQTLLYMHDYGTLPLHTSKLNNQVILPQSPTNLFCGTLAKTLAS